MMKSILIVIGFLSVCFGAVNAEDKGSWEALQNEVKGLGKPEWRPMLMYVAKLHEKSTHDPEWPLEYPWEEIGPGFELRMWRGGAWNSMTYWAIRGCLNYGREDAAVKLAERALDDTAKQFDRTGTIWEFYHPDGGTPEDVRRKGESLASTPYQDYLGHNPVIAMARIYDVLSDEKSPAQAKH